MPNSGKQINQEPTLRDIKEQLDRQERKMMMMFSLAVAFWSLSILLGAVILWAGRMLIPSIFKLEFITLFIVGLVVIFYSLYNARQIKKRLKD